MFSYHSGCVACESVTIINGRQRRKKGTYHAKGPADRVIYTDPTFFLESVLLVFLLDARPNRKRLQHNRHHKGPQEGKDHNPEADKVEVCPCFRVKSIHRVLVLEKEERLGKGYPQLEMAHKHHCNDCCRHIYFAIW